MDRHTHVNQTTTENGISRLDHIGIARWLPEALARYTDYNVEAIVPVAHGAGFAALIDDQLAFAPPDYEATPPEDIVRDYRDARDGFTLTGSPPLPAGLNFGTQLYWFDKIEPDAMKQATLIPWAQYWAWFLSGEAVSEISSFGCHSDLWLPSENSFSPLAEKMGWDSRFAPIARADEIVGHLRSELADATGLSPTIKIHAGLHDSNAALLAARGFAQVADREATILSTGTWFIAMRLARDPVDIATLSQRRDCLVNVDPFGNPVPSARFMGGREIELLLGSDTEQVDSETARDETLIAAQRVLSRKPMISPTLAPGCGPFPDQSGGWIERPTDGAERRAAICLYAALMIDTSLDLIGSKETLVVEGRFARADIFVRALAALRPETDVYVANAENDVAFGALRLIDPEIRPQGDLTRVEPLEGDIGAYRAAWLNLLEKAA